MRGLGEGGRGQGAEGPAGEERGWEGEGRERGAEGRGRAEVAMAAGASAMVGEPCPRVQAAGGTHSEAGERAAAVASVEVTTAPVAVERAGAAEGALEEWLRTTLLWFLGACLHSLARLCLKCPPQ